MRLIVKLESNVLIILGQSTGKLVIYNAASGTAGTW